MSPQPKKFLIFAKPAIGDILLATPLMRSIRHSEPDAVIDVMCYPGQGGILEGNPDVDNVIVIEQKASMRMLLALAYSLFRKYDIAITNAADDRVHLYILVFGKKRVSVKLESGAAWKHWITEASVLDDPVNQHALQRNNHLGEVLGYDSHYQIQVPKLAAGETPSDKLMAAIRSGKPYAVLHPDARLPYKRWTATGWLDVMRYLDSRGLNTYVTGGSSSEESDYINSLLIDAPKSASSLAGQLRFAEVSELIRESRIFIGIDTVNSHLAAAIGSPTIALFGPENPRRWGPWPKGYAEDRSPWFAAGSQRKHNVLIVQGESGCDKCVQGDCKRRHNRGTDCPLMTGISSQQVLDGIREMLD